MTYQLNRMATHRRTHKNPRGLADSLALKLLRALRELHASEVPVGGGAYRQSPDLRLIVRTTAERLTDTLAQIMREKEEA